jgi:hypothetical protein
MPGGGGGNGDRSGRASKSKTSTPAATGATGMSEAVLSAIDPSSDDHKQMRNRKESALGERLLQGG